MTDHTPLKNHWGYKCHKEWICNFTKCKFVTIHEHYHHDNLLEVTCWSELPIPEGDDSGRISWNGNGVELCVLLLEKSKDNIRAILGDTKDRFFSFEKEFMHFDGGKAIWQLPKNSDQ